MTENIDSTEDFLEYSSAKRLLSYEITKECDTNHHPSRRQERLAVAVTVMERTARDCEPRAKNPDFRIELVVNKSTPSTAVMPTNPCK